MKTSQCRSCGADIIWTITANGKKMPVDAEPAERPQGVFHLDERESGEVHSRSAAGELVYLSHFATCPNADQHRKGD